MPTKAKQGKARERRGKGEEEREDGVGRRRRRRGRRRNPGRRTERVRPGAGLRASRRSVSTLFTDLSLIKSNFIFFLISYVFFFFDKKKFLFSFPQSRTTLDGELKVRKEGNVD
ncbi:hypothetical protein BO99DRAFT_186353 [Aspergillus violaceofuscus CBS 115571]|uniref:Uncharacterized protein n=1 Tax=Aspergillus violaceofuscus (strain CBS 115571) TaxID=1450538 RepID=A0A2V5H9V3_ASPV1|nr:hypothetical protein BO99DRAFT_186353 [Aspergillus violaceofuscus CBS 115571]